MDDPIYRSSSVKTSLGDEANETELFDLGGYEQPCGIDAHDFRLQYAFGGEDDGPSTICQRCEIDSARCAGVQRMGCYARWKRECADSATGQRLPGKAGLRRRFLCSQGSGAIPDRSASFPGDTQSS